MTYLCRYEDITQGATSIYNPGWHSQIISISTDGDDDDDDDDEGDDDDDDDDDDDNNDNDVDDKVILKFWSEVEFLEERNRKGSEGSLPIPNPNSPSLLDNHPIPPFQ